MMNKIYVITGATSGIGKALTLKLIESGHKVFAGYRNKDKLTGLVSENIIPFYVDYSSPETIASATDYIKSKTDKIDTLINAAGCVAAGPIEVINPDEIRRQFDVNVFGHLELTQRLVELLTNGTIINLSSMASYGVFPFISPYCASKRCLDMFFNSFLIENKRNIKVISIKPGVISTPLWGKSIRENSKYLADCKDYKNEMNFLIRNAEKNERTGLPADCVVKVILEADRAKNPKVSYTIGKDALLAEFLSKLPQSFINRLVKFGLKARIRRNTKI